MIRSSSGPAGEREHVVRKVAAQSPLIVAFALAGALLAGCGAKAPAPAAPAAPEVGVLRIEVRSAPLTLDIVSDIRAFREVELRPRVGGVVERQLFEPGQMVREGQPLFVIDTRALDSAVLDAQARLIEAEAQLTRATEDVDRYQPLLADDAIPRQTYDSAVAVAKQAASIVESRREGVNRARLDRSFAEVRSPLSGQIGLQKVEIGSLATAGQTVLATVSSLDPVVAYFSVAESEYLSFARRHQAAVASGRTPRRPVQLLLADGSLHPHDGRFDFADRAINPQTGTLTLRAVFPNPEHVIRPGMTGRVRVTYDVVDKAIVIPQKAVTEMLGKQFVSVVGADNKVEQRAVTTGDRMGDMWLIETGLQAGETIVVEGVQKARPGSVVKPMPLASPAGAAGQATAVPAAAKP
jgi:RND family efflux transporter MFP subunit